ncbi:RNase adapter RapZ [Arthrobacter sp. SO3]|uniref:RapZ C-terminal domain-containing protein n=1 Tax=Arthrobacter sp. SO3 TaxID=1897057 RepID=UPI001D0008D4|nr:RNase adapter RapZ [Arthrobacter sp. SO3]
MATRTPTPTPIARLWVVTVASITAVSLLGIICSTLNGISSEREVLRAVTSAADVVLDTTDMNVRNLSTAVTSAFSATGTIVVRINVMSFGFKYGSPLDANHVADVRFISNPHWVPELQPLTGVDPQVRDYGVDSERATEFRDRCVQALAARLAQFPTVTASAHHRHLGRE